MQIITHSEEETKKFAEKLAPTLRGGDIVLLYGELGAGKTTLVKGLAASFEIEEEITSPTFTLMNIYEIKELKNPKLKIKNLKLKIKKLLHIDTYRLKNEQELLDIGVEDYLGAPDIITIIEWPEKISTILQNKKALVISIEHLTPTERKITVTS